MRTIIPRHCRRHAPSLAILLAAVVLALVLAWAVMVVWIKGGPQPVHPIVIAIPAPQMPGRPA